MNRDTHTGDGSEYLQQLDACIYKLGPLVKYSGEQSTGILPTKRSGMHATLSALQLDMGEAENKSDVYLLCQRGLATKRAPTERLALEDQPFTECLYTT